jgi:peptidoglycan hydrolase-like protein with peptidoglycan-binding domain
MKPLLLASAMLLAQGAFATGLTSLHPEEAIPDPAKPVEAGEYSDLISQVQEKLNARGFDAGPVNGDWNEKTQAALAQFQLSLLLPAGGQLDEQTLMELGVERAPL